MATILQQIDEAISEARRIADSCRCREWRVSFNNGYSINCKDDRYPNDVEILADYAKKPSKKQILQVIERNADEHSYIWIEGRVDLARNMLDYARNNDYNPEPCAYWEVDLYKDGKNLVIENG